MKAAASVPAFSKPFPDANRTPLGQTQMNVCTWQEASAIPVPTYSTDVSSSPLAAPFSHSTEERKIVLGIPARQKHKQQQAAAPRRLLLQGAQVVVCSAVP